MTARDIIDPVQPDDADVEEVDVDVTIDPGAEPTDKAETGFVEDDDDDGAEGEGS